MHLAQRGFRVSTRRTLPKRSAAVNAQGGTTSPRALLRLKRRSRSFMSAGWRLNFNIALGDRDPPGFFPPFILRGRRRLRHGCPCGSV